jgi:hypothetical protein
MKGLKAKGLGLVAAAAVAAIGAGLLASTVLAVSGTIGVGSASAEPGGQATVDLTANVGDPGLGAWTVDIEYDASVVSVESCEPEQGGVCNDAFTETSVRITGANAGGLEGEKVLGSITFECGDAEGSSDLTLSVSVFADATPGAPTDISYTASNGSIDCEEPPPTDTAAPATDTPEPGLPLTGTGSDSGGGLGWLVAVLAAAGAATVVGFGALRLRGRRA